MNNREVKDLLNRYNQDQCTPEEKAFIETWYLNQEVEQLPYTIEEMGTDLDEVEYQIAEHAKLRKVKLWPKITTVAAAVLILISAGLLYEQQKHQANHVANVFENDITPGSNKAILTLADGSKIALDDAANQQLATQSGVNITKTKEGQLVYAAGGLKNNRADHPTYNTISIPRGGQYQIRLSDGTRIWLNAASTLTYPSSFAKTGQRKVTLKGEAYFEVAKDKHHPFLVETDKQVVEVLGTHFNISNYADERSTKTTLLEGSVRVSTGIIKRSITLKPGQQAVLTGKNIKLTTVNLEENIAWKNGYFRFNDENIQSVMRKLSRWYDIDVNYAGEISTIGFNGKLSRFNNISQVLNALESTKRIHFKVEGRRVTVIK